MRQQSKKDVDRSSILIEGATQRTARRGRTVVSVTIFGALLKKSTDGVSEQNTPSVRTFVSSEQTRAAALAISKYNRCTNNQERQGRRLGRGDRVDDHIIELLFR